ncbi:hypothetical protein H4Q26_001007 [Puccinia striiformis f. sp. tritici PST-130]|nr:hypothetical protein H4Q26_001007 [Puccinia striiformis f. sp. tritici PST-130]
MTGFMLASSEEIKLAIEWLEGSEFDLVRKHGPWRCRINLQLEMLMDLINRTTQLEEDEEHLSESATQLGKSLLPIIKLSRLFINKLMMRGMNKKYLPLFTEMRSDQMESLAGLARDVNGMVTQLMNFMRVADQSLASNISKFSLILLSNSNVIYYLAYPFSSFTLSLSFRIVMGFRCKITSDLGCYLVHSVQFRNPTTQRCCRIVCNTSPALPESPNFPFFFFFDRLSILVLNNNDEHDTNL